MLISLATQIVVDKRAIVISVACYLAVRAIGKRFASYNKRKEAREIWLEQVKQNGNALDYASSELKADREIVMEAVKQNGVALRYAAAALKADLDVVFEAVNQDEKARQYALQSLNFLNALNKRCFVDLR